MSAPTPPPLPGMPPHNGQQPHQNHGGYPQPNSPAGYPGAAQQPGHPQPGFQHHGFQQQGFPQQGYPNPAPTKRSPGRIIGGVLMLILGVLMLLSKLASAANPDTQPAATSDSARAAGRMTANFLWVGLAIVLIAFGIRMFKARKR